MLARKEYQHKIKTRIADGAIRSNLGLQGSPPQGSQPSTSEAVIPMTNHNHPVPGENSCILPVAVPEHPWQGNLITLTNP